MLWGPLCQGSTRTPRIPPPYPRIRGSGGLRRGVRGPPEGGPGASGGGPGGLRRGSRGPPGGAREGPDLTLRRGKKRPPGGAKFGVREGANSGSWRPEFGVRARFGHFCQKVPIWSKFTNLLKGGKSVNRVRPEASQAR